MRFDETAAALDGIPFTGVEQGRVLYDWVVENEPTDILEIGTFHGVSACYLAAALQELGTGKVVTIDKEHSKDRDPSVLGLADTLGLHEHIQPIFAERSFTWELWRMLDADPRPQFDLVFHDAFHTWDVVGYGFFLTDKLLRPGGWMLFDDMYWTINHLPEEKRGARARYPAEERSIAAVGEAFRLLVREHPDYTGSRIDNDGQWGWARKRPRSD